MLRVRGCIRISLSCLVHEDSKTAQCKREEARQPPVLWECHMPARKQRGLHHLLFPICQRGHTPGRGSGSHHWGPQVENAAWGPHTIHFEPFTREPGLIPWCLTTLFTSVTTKNHVFSVLRWLNLPASLFSNPWDVKSTISTFPGSPVALTTEIWLPLEPSWMESV